MVTPSELRTDGEDTQDMVNPHFEPTSTEDTVLEVLKEEQRANPYLIREQTELGKGDINTALTRLTSAGWVRKVTRGLYEYVDDPREGEDGGAEPEQEPTSRSQAATQQPEEQEEEEIAEEEESEPVNVREQLEDALPGSGDKLDARVDAVLRMYDLLQQREGEKVRTQNLKDLVDADDVEYSSVDSFWTNAVKKNKAQGRPNAVTLLPGVEERGNGRYQYTEGGDE